jgi:predicted Rossmann fold flavoprotein
MLKQDVIIIGAGAAGLMCAIEAGKRGRTVTILEHSNKPGKKILMSGGGRCNFTNYYITPDNYLSQNPHFCKSALSRYTQWDFIQLVEKYNIAYYEKTKGQLFCQHKANDLLNMLLTEAVNNDVKIKTHTDVLKIEHIKDNHFKLVTSNGDYHAQSLVIATGGLSIPTMGASPFGYKVAEQFNLKVLPTRAGLVPFTYTEQQKQKYEVLAGVTLDSEVFCNKQSFKEGILFTHRGLSGPSILQISSYWNLGDLVSINLLPNFDLKVELQQAVSTLGDKKIKTVLTQYLPTNLPKNLLKAFFAEEFLDYSLKQLNQHQLDYLCDTIANWQFKPNGTEGYRTAEVTLGGVDVNQISSKTMEAQNIKGLYFIGEVLDVTGWLGGYNFQWAWSSGWVAGQFV